MHPEAGRVKLTYDDFLLFPDDGQRHELIDGVHYVTPSPNVKHQTIAVNLAGFIWSYLQERPIGRVFTAPLDVLFSSFDVVEPDLLYMSNDRARSILTDAHVAGAPELVVEIGSKSTRKRDDTVKRRLYERFGVEEYWVVDPERDTIKVFRRVEGRYERVAELARDRNDILTTPLFPDLALQLARVFD